MVSVFAQRNATLKDRGLQLTSDVLRVENSIQTGKNQVACHPAPSYWTRTHVLDAFINGGGQDGHP